MKRIPRKNLHLYFQKYLFKCLRCFIHQKTPHCGVFSSGERGIRTPGPVTVNGFQDRRIRPLCHLSAANVVQIF
jgi:hypothetical protein